MTTKEEFKLRIASQQWAMLIINIFVIAIGGCMFGLAVVTRPILRITNHHYLSEMQAICDVMVAVGIVQIVVASYDIFAACWKLIRVIYGAIVAACIAVILEIGGIVLTIYVQIDSKVFLSQDVSRPWFVWECLPSKGCEGAMSYYVDYLMIPQVILGAISIVLHCMSIIYLVKLTRTLREKQNQIWKAKELRNHTFRAKRGLSKKASDNNNLMPNIEEDEDEEEEVHSDATPSSILKEEHGYVPAPGPSLDSDYDDAGCIRNRSKQGNQQPNQQSLSFNTDVEIHLFNPQKSEEGHHNTTQM